MSQDKRQSPGYEPLSPGRQLVVGAFLVCSLWYLGWRATTLNPDAYVFSCVVYGAELFGFVSVLLHLFMIWRLSERQSPPVLTGRSVDVFIPTINEPVSIVRQTLLAALHMDYPHETWLLDDGNRPEMAQLAEELGARYLARDNNDNAKAGNLNNALAHSSSEFVAIFDADHAPQRHFLERTLGYFADERVAFVQTPQDFYNLDSYQHRRRGNGRHVWTEQSLFFRIIQRGKDYWNAAFFCGSCAVMRRSALQEVGGFATGTVTEDLHTSLRLHMKKFRSVYHAESLAFGLAPDTISAFLGQRIRWGEGAMKVWRSEGLLFNRRLSLPQRLNYLASVLTYFDGWQKLVFYAAPAIVLLTGLLPIYTTVESFLLHFIPYFVLTLWVFEESARGYGSFLQTEEYNMARFYAFARATLGWLGAGRKFKVTPKDVHGDITEREKIIPQYTVLAVNLLAIPVGYLLYLHYQWLPTGGMFANILWASANAWLAYSLVTFTTHKRHKRINYRFALPVPVKIGHQGKSRFGIIDDVSSSGFRLYARLAEGAQPGEVLSGELWLPGKHLPFEAEIKHLVTAHDSSGDYIKAYGCAFNWQGNEMHDQLDQYLFGSGLQWQIQGLQESSRTPLQWLSDLLHGNRDVTDHDAPCWAAFVYRMPGSIGTDEVAGLIEVAEPGQNGRKVLLYHPVNKGVLLRGRIITPLCESDIILSATDTRQIETQLTPVFMTTTEVYTGSNTEAELPRVDELVTASSGATGQHVDAVIPRRRDLS